MSRAEEPEFDDWQFQDRQFLGLTQVNRQMRREFLPNHTDRVTVRLEAAYCADYIALHCPTIGSTSCKLSICSIIIKHPPWGNELDILPLIHLTARNPSMRLYLQLGLREYVELHQHPITRALLPDKIPVRDALKSAKLVEDWSRIQVIWFLRLEFQKRYPSYDINTCMIAITKCKDPFVSLLRESSEGKLARHGLEEMGACDHVSELEEWQM